MRGTATPLTRGPISLTIPDTAGPLMIPADGSGSGLSDSLMAWVEGIDVFMTAVSHTNFNTVTNETNHLYKGFLVSSGAQNDEVSFYAMLAAGTWTFNLIHDTAGAMGIYTILFDGVSKGTIDGYGASVNNVRSRITSITVATSGRVTVTIKMATKNASSSGYYGQISHIALQRTA